MGSSNETGPQNSQELNTLSKCPGATWNKKEVSTTEVHGISHQGICLRPLPSSLSGCASVIVFTEAKRNAQLGPDMADRAPPCGYTEDLQCSLCGSPLVNTGPFTQADSVAVFAPGTTAGATVALDWGPGRSSSHEWQKYPGGC